MPETLLPKYGYNAGNQSKKNVIVGVDGLPEAIDLIDKGIMTGTVIQNPNVIAEAIYSIGMNLVKNVNPVENTNYQVNDSEIVITIPNDQYTNKTRDVFIKAHERK